MKIKIYIFMFFIVLFGKINAQDNTIHWLVNEDLETDCSYLYSGKFLNKETCCVATEGYSIEFFKNSVIEKIENEKYFVKSNIEFTSDCNYVLTIIDTNIPDYDVIGNKIFGEILATAKTDNLIKIKVTSEENSVIVVFEKQFDKIVPRGTQD